MPAFLVVTFKTVTKAMAARPASSPSNRPTPAQRRLRANISQQASAQVCCPSMTRGVVFVIMAPCFAASGNCIAL